MPRHSPCALSNLTNVNGLKIKKELTSRVRHQLRSMPLLSFYIDDTLDYVFKMEELLKKVKTDDETRH